jgi:patatin-like phospholipase/acyl hydrolase
VTQRYLLSIDGGGIRGIIPALALVRLEQTTGQLTRDTFSFVAGTSTGAIIAAAVAAGIPATHILDIYLTRALDVFPQRPWNLLNRIARGWMYSTQAFHDRLTEELGPAQTWTLNDAPIDLLITAKRVTDGQPWYFVRDNTKNSQRTGRLSLVDCVTFLLLADA